MRTAIPAKPALVLILLSCLLPPLAAQDSSGLFSVSGRVDWSAYRLESTISLNVAKADLRLPSGRSQAESMVRRQAPALLRDTLLDLPLDSQRSIGDAIASGDLDLEAVELQLEAASAVRSSFSDDFLYFKADYSISLLGIQGLLVRHSRPYGQARTLDYRPTKQYTGIVIYASESLPVHGEPASALFSPSFFPRIWDEEMTPLLERNMVDPESVMKRGMVGYKKDGDGEFIEDRVGAEPLRILARGVFGSKRTDLIISKEDSLKILGSEGNRALLSSGRVVIVASEVEQKF